MEKIKSKTRRIFNQSMRYTIAARQETSKHMHRATPTTQSSTPVLADASLNCTSLRPRDVYKYGTNPALSIQSCFFRLLSPTNTMRFSTAFITAAIAAVATASPVAKALPWAKANPQAAAAAEAYAEAFAEAQAIGHPDPEAFALAASADDCATVDCHASCGLMIVAGTACSENTDDTYSGPYTEGCLCGSSDTDFLSYYAACMDCGWTLWKYYGGYLENALAECAVENTAYPATEPTGTARCSTTLTDSYTVDPSINYSTYV